MPLRAFKFLLLRLAVCLGIVLLVVRADAATTITYTDGQPANTNTYNTDDSGAPYTFTIASGAATQSGTVTGATGFTKTGAGALTLGGSSDNVALTATISAGTLVLGKASSNSVHAIGGGNTSVTINSGGTLQFGGTGGDQIFDWASMALNSGGILDMNSRSEAFDGLTGSGTVTNTASGTTGVLTLGANNFVSAPTPGNVTFDGVIQNGAGTLALVKSGSGTLNLTSAQTYTGATTVSAGALALLGSGRLSNSTALTVASGATFYLNGITDTIGSLAGAGTVLLVNGTLTAGGDNTTTAFSGAITSGTLAKAGSGTFTLSGSTDNLNLIASVSAGTLVLGKTSSGTVHAVGLGLTINSGGTAKLGGTGGDQIYTGVNVTLNSGGTFDMNGLSEGFNNLTGSGTVTNTASSTTSTLTLGENSGDATFDGVLQNGAGTLALAKSGSGTLTLTGGNTLTGGTAISAGTLQIGAGGTTGTLSGNITNNAALAFSRSDASTYAGVISGSGSVTKLGAGTLTLTGNNTYVGATTVSTGTLALTGSGRLSDSTALTVASGATIDLTDLTETVGSLAGGGGVVVGAGALTAGGNGTSTIFSGIIFGSGSFTKSGAGTLTITAENAYAGGTTISGGTLQIGNGGTQGWIAGNFTNNGNLTFNRSNGNTLSSVISGTGSVTKLGAGSLTLSGANTYTGGTTISAGTLQLGNSGANLSDTGAVTVNGGIFAIGSASEAIGPLSGTGGEIDLYAGGNYNLFVNQSVPGTYAGVITGILGGFVKQGASTLTLTGANTYAGNTLVSGGTLALSGAGKVGAGTLYITNDAILDLGGTTQTVQYVGTPRGLGGTPISGSISAGTINVTGEAHLESGTFANTFAGSGSGVTLYIGGNALATVTLNGTNDLVDTGSHVGVSIGNEVLTGDAGTVRIGNANALAASSETIYMESGTLDLNGVTGVRGAGIQMYGATAAVVNQNTAASASFNGTVALGYNSNLLGGNGDLLLGGVVSGGGIRLLKSGTGILTLSGDNTYSGGTSVSAGTVLLGHVNGAGTTGTIDIASGATFDTAGFGFDLTRLAGTGSATGTGVFTYNSNSSSAPLGIALAGTASLAKSGTGTLTLAGNNTYTGVTTISAGTLQIGNSGTTGSLAGNIVNNAALTFDRSTASSYAGVISGGGTLSKRGAGTLTLTGASTYTGQTFVTGGTLKVNGSLTSTASVLVNNGGTLGGSGTVGGGTVTISTGGTISPGNSPGTLNTGNETWAGGGSYAWEINKATGGTKGADPGWDWLNITGTLDITASTGSKFTINITSLTLANASGLATGFVRGQTYTFTIATASGGITNFNANKFLIDTSAFFNDPTNIGGFAISQAGNSLVLNYTAVPEPAEWGAFFGLGLLALAATRKLSRSR